MNDAPRIGLIACRVLEEEIALHGGNAPHVLATQFLEIALHDRPLVLRSKLQNAVNSLDANTELEAVVLAYALCGLGTAGIRAGRHKLVIPRAHDCITLFMGSKERFAAQQSAEPDSFYYTPGWMKARRTPSPERLETLRAELLEKFEPDDVDFLVETERANWVKHSQAVYLDLGTASADADARKAQTDAQGLGWKFKRLSGDPSLLRDLMAGKWDNERFQIVAPGQELSHSPDQRIFCCRETISPS